MPAEPATEPPSWVESLEDARKAVEGGIGDESRAAVDEAFTSSARQALACHEVICDSAIIAQTNAQEWHSFFKQLYLVTWRSLIPKARVFATDSEKKSTSRYETMIGLLNAIKTTASDAMIAIDEFANKPSRVNRKAALRSVEFACNALDAWRPG
jgi:hypothetical protein